MPVTISGMFVGHAAKDTELSAIDLAALACRAAIELDNTILGRGQHLEAVKDLTDQIAYMVERSKPAASVSLMDPTAIVLMKRAIEDSAVGSMPLATLDEFTEKANSVQNGLSELLKEAKPKIEQLKQMRTFCLALSESASLYQQSIDDLRQPYPSFATALF